MLFDNYMVEYNPDGTLYEVRTRQGAVAQFPSFNQDSEEYEFLAVSNSRPYRLGSYSWYITDEDEPTDMVNLVVYVSRSSLRVAFLFTYHNLFQQETEDYDPYMMRRDPPSSYGGMEDGVPVPDYESFWERFVGTDIYGDLWRSLARQDYAGITPSPPSLGASSL